MKSLRGALDKLLDAAVASPGAAWTPAQRSVVDTIVQLLADADKEL